MFINPFVALLVNSTAGTFHPIIFNESPMPGHLAAFREADSQALVSRWKSYGHHTTGFPTRAAALENIRDELVDRINERATTPLRYLLKPEQVMEWDGHEVPAIKAMFLLSDLEESLPSMDASAPGHTGAPASATPEEAQPTAQG